MSHFDFFRFGLHRFNRTVSAIFHQLGASERRKRITKKTLNKSATASDADVQVEPSVKVIVVAAARRAGCCYWSVLPLTAFALLFSLLVTYGALQNRYTYANAFVADVNRKFSTRARDKPLQFSRWSLAERAL